MNVAEPFSGPPKGLMLCSVPSCFPVKVWNAALLPVLTLSKVERGQRGPGPCQEDTGKDNKKLSQGDSAGRSRCFLCSASGQALLSTCVPESQMPASSLEPSVESLGVTIGQEIYLLVSASLLEPNWLEGHLESWRALCWVVTRDS